MSRTCRNRHPDRLPQSPAVRAADLTSLQWTLPQSANLACHVAGFRSDVAGDCYNDKAWSLIQSGLPARLRGLYLLRQLEMDEEELARCRAVWKQPEPRYGRGVLAKFSALARPPTKAR